MNHPLSLKAISIATADDPVNNNRLLSVCGERHKNLSILESELGVECFHQGNEFVVRGTPRQIELTSAVLTRLYAMTKDHPDLPEADIYQVINNESRSDNESFDPALVSAPLAQIKAKTKTQAAYMRAISEYDVVFGIGPAGTGKTFLAVAKAVEALLDEQVRRIVLVRPIVEAGEHLGFLPGDIGQKIDPYLRPLYDALYTLLGAERVAKLIERNAIELAPLAYMRGRTLSDAFVIMDEAQNTTVAQMKMLLTRIGFGSKVVITGDLSQLDLPKGTYSGLKHALTILHNVKGIDVIKFNGRDIVRHPLVQRIVEAYEKHERNE